MYISACRVEIHKAAAQVVINLLKRKFFLNLRMLRVTGLSQSDFSHIII